MGHLALLMGSVKVIILDQHLERLVLGFNLKRLGVVSLYIPPTEFSQFVSFTAAP